MIDTPQTTAIATALAALPPRERAEVLARAIGTVEEIDALQFLEASVHDAALSTTPRLTLGRPDPGEDPMICSGCDQPVTELLRWERLDEPVHTWHINTGSWSLEEQKNGLLTNELLWFTPCCHVEVSIDDTVWVIHHN